MSRILIKLVANCFLVYFLNRLFPQYFSLFGGITAVMIMGGLLTAMNFIVRPILAMILAPLHFLFTLLAVLLANWGFLWIIYQVVLKMDPGLITLVISGGIAGWIVVSSILGFVNWLLKALLG